MDKQRGKYSQINNYVVVIVSHLRLLNFGVLWFN